jgi:hypothetical protein
VTVASLPAPAWPLRIDDDPAVSREADDLRGHFRLLEQSVSDSLALGRLRGEVKSKLDRTWVDASVDGWDGYGAKGVSSATYGNARAFLETLPTTTPMPDVVPEPDGEIAFEWDYGPWRILSVSVGPTGLLSYAALYGRTSKVHGTEQLIDKLPGAIAVCLDRLVAAGNGDA